MPEWYDLNARHMATFLWVAAISGFAFVRSAKARSAVLHVLATFLQPSIALVFLGLFANVTIVTTVAVIGGRNVGFWETLPIVSATIWFLTAGFSLLFHLPEFFGARKEFRRRAVAVLGPSTLITEVVGVSILTFWWELFLMPVLLILAFTVYTVRKAASTIVPASLLLIYVVGLISLVVVELIANFDTWKSLVQAIVFPLVLTIGTMPYIQLLILVERFRFRIGAKCKEVESREYGSDWPLTVDSAMLCCRFRAVWVEVNGKKYGLNGTASSVLRRHGHTCLDLNDILRDHPDRENWAEAFGTGEGPVEWKVSVHQLIQDGLALEHQR